MLQTEVIPANIRGLQLMAFDLQLGGKSYHLFHN